MRRPVPPVPAARPGLGFGAVLALGAGLALAPAGAAASERPLLDLLTPEAELELARVPDTQVLCAAGAVVRFNLGRAAAVTLVVAGETAAGTIDGGAPRLLSALSLDAGPHEAVISAEPRDTLALGERPFTLTATAGDAAPPAMITGVLRDERIDRAVLPVGRTFVSGVDLLDGQLVLQVTDLQLEGRHLALELTRTYSSAGGSEAGLAGAGWRLNYESAVTPVPTCGLVLVRTADGGTQAFVGSGGSDLRPERAHHTRLSGRSDGSYDFVDKAAIRHHFAGRARGTAASLRLAWIEEPHGDRIVLTYDARGRLLQASEWHPLLGPVRTLVFSPSTAGGADRVAAVHAWGLGRKVTFRHDEWGNLVAATRADREGSSETDRYEYETSNTRDRHQLTSNSPHGGGRTAYAYGPAPEGPGAPAGGGPWWDPREPVREVRPATGDPTRFTYDRTEASAGRFRAGVRLGHGPVTRYLLNTDGNPLEIDEPAGAARSVVRLTWDATHVVKTGELHDDGRSLSWKYDDAGNLVLEREVPRAGAPARTMTWEYDQRFNKLVRKVDAEGQRSVWTLDPRTGDLLREEVPEGRTTWDYDDAGCVRERRDVDGRTLFLRPDTFCNATEIHKPDGSVVRRRYDAAGSLMDEATTASR